MKELDFGSWFSEEFKNQSIPTLDEVMELISTENILFNIELKSGAVLYHDIERIVVDMVKEYEMEERVIISSFNHYSLLEVKKIAPEIKIGFLYSAGLVEPWEYAKGLALKQFIPYIYSIPPGSIKACNENKVLVNPYTIDIPEHIKFAALAGVDELLPMCLM